MRFVHSLRFALPVLFVLPLLAQQSGKGEPTAKETQGGQREVATGSYKIDPVHSSNVFRLKHMNVAYFYGRFNELEGRFALDDAQPEAAKFEVTLNAASIDTNNEARDKHVRSPDYFDTDRYPEITFQSQSVKKVDAGVLEVSGELTMHGQSRPLTTRVELTGTGKGMQGEFRAGWETTFTVKRSDFGMKVAPGLSDEVRITVSVEGVRN